MDTRKLQVAPKVGQVVIVQDDEIVARLYHSDRRDNVEATEYAEELVCRWNMHEELVKALEHVVSVGGDPDDDATFDDLDWNMIRSTLKSVQSNG